MISATVPLRTAAKAANTSTRTVRRYLEMGIVKLRGCDRKSSGSGDHAGISRRRTLQLAIIHDLTIVGVALASASAAAIQFSDVGQTGRSAGQLFEHGKTLLVIGTDGAKVINSDYDASWPDLSHRAVSIIVVDLNKIVEQVDAVLNP